MAPSVSAPDGSQVRVLLRLKGGSMATFRLRPGQVAVAVAVAVTLPPWPGEDEAVLLPGPFDRDDLLPTVLR